MRPNEGSNARTALEGRGALSGDQRQKRRMYQACHAYFSECIMCLLLILQRRTDLCIQGARRRMQIRAQKAEEENERSAAAVGEVGEAGSGEVDLWEEKDTGCRPRGVVLTA